METAVPALIIVTLLLVVALSLAHAYLSAQEDVSESWQAMLERAERRSATDLSLASPQITGENDVIEITVRNDGQTKLVDFDRWDVLVAYGTGSAYLDEWYPYTAAGIPGYNEWAVSGIYLDASSGTPEATDPGILNPGEEMIIQLRVSPPVGAGTTNLVTLGTLDGICATTVFTN